METVTTAQAAKKLGLGVTYVGRLVKQGILTGRKDGHGYAIDPASLENFKPQRTRRRLKAAEMRARSARAPQTVRMEEAPPAPNALARVEQRLTQVEALLQRVLDVLT